MQFVSVSQAAELWGVSERSVRNYCAQGRVPGAALRGKTWLIPADATKPTRSNAKASTPSPLLLRLRQEKEAGIKGGIYHRAQIDLAYNSNRIEGSRLSEEQTRRIFDTATIGVQDEPLRIDDLTETANHFRAFDYVLDHAEQPLTEPIIKKLHHLLKRGTTDAALPWFNVGAYKQLPNEVNGEATTTPENVAAAMHELLDAYTAKASHDLVDILDFHVRFERIHPFQDGNGRVGRLIMLKECLAQGITPFIIEDEMKLFYYRGLAEWENEPGYLTDTCLAAQDRFATLLEYFRIDS